MDHGMRGKRLRSGRSGPFVVHARASLRHGFATIGHLVGRKQSMTS